MRAVKYYRSQECDPVSISRFVTSKCEGIAPVTR